MNDVLDELKPGLAIIIILLGLLLQTTCNIMLDVEKIREQMVEEVNE